MLSNTILLAAAAILGVTSAQSNIVITYNCDTFKSECAADNSSNCDSRYDACMGCSTQEHSCRVGAGNDYGSQLSCTSAAEVCYQMAVAPGTANGYYGCKEADNSCRTGTMANQSLCASQLPACEACQTQENECRNKPQANQSYCSAQASSCFRDAVTSDGEL